MGVTKQDTRSLDYSPNNVGTYPHKKLRGMHLDSRKVFLLEAGLGTFKVERHGSRICWATSRYNISYQRK